MDAAVGDPIGVVYDTQAPISWWPPGVRFGVYQALTTRNGGEVISADSF